MSFARRKLTMTITLGEGKFGDTKGATITLTDVQMSVSISTPGGAAQGLLNAQVRGLPLETINQLTQIGPTAFAVRRGNTVQVAAGDDGEAQTVVYEGTIWEAYGDFQSAPDVALNIVANSAMAAAMVPIGANSWRDSVSVDTIMSTLAKIAGYSYENNGVTTVLSNPYLPGTALMQIQQCARAAGINHSIHNNILAIWPKNGNRKAAIPVVSSDTGMVGYPIFTAAGLTLNSLFIPNIVNGNKVQVVSQIPLANGVWGVSSVLHTLESNKPGGAWFTQLTVSNKNGE